MPDIKSEPAPRRAARVSTLAAEIEISEDVVMRWIRDGHLIAFADPLAEIGGRKRGPKNLRVWRDDWERFLRSQSRTGGHPDPKAEAPAAKAAPAKAGPDGVSRLRRARAK